MTDLQTTTGLATGWLDRRAHLDLHPDAERALRSAALCWHREREAEAYLARATELAGEHIAVLIANYRYRLYKHRFEEARQAAARCLALAAARLAIPADFQQISAGHANFASPDPDVRFWLFTLQAYGYVSLRAGHAEEGRLALERLALLDTSDQTKTQVLLQVISSAGHSDD
ncbi:MAG TPA: hypothetical protein VFK05_27970 [Polyangiaceae bacterium]|nr:hypothetical protein [Polyangiaceae bacterium]